GIGAGGHNRRQSRVVKTKVISRGVAAFIMRSRHVSPAYQAQEGRQGAPLLEHRGESPDRRRPGGAAAAAVPGRDQRFAGTGLAQVNRHPGGRGIAAAHAVAVSGGPLRGIAAGRLDRSVAAKRTAVVPAAPVACRRRYLTADFEPRLPKPMRSERAAPPSYLPSW